MSKRLLGIGDVYTYDYKQVHKTRNVGFGYYDPNKVSTTSSTDGYVLVDGVLSVVNEDGSNEPGPTPPEPFPYRTVKIGNQTWMAEDLTGDDGEGGVSAADLNDVNGYDLGTQYYYQWDAAIRMAEKYPGWHLPSSADFNELIEYFGDTTAAGYGLRSTYAWKYNNGNDTYGFTMLPVDNGYMCWFWSNKGNSNRAYQYGTTDRPSATKIPTFASGNTNSTAYKPVRLIKD